MSAIWLDAPPNLRSPEEGDAVRLLGCGPVAAVEDRVCALAGHEILVTGRCPLLLPTLRRCRWVRGVVRIGGPALRDQIKILDLQAEAVAAHEDLSATEVRVRAAIVAMARRLRALDALAEGWEGT